MKRLRPSLIFLLSILATHWVFAQDKQSAVDTARIGEMLRSGTPFGPNQFNFISCQDNVMGPSPEAAKMTKYSDTPVSYALGQAEIGIPIYTVEGRSLRLPITLSYDASGIKPEEVSGIVGLGWSLQAGGVITRTIIGRKDDIEFEPEITDTTMAEYLVGASMSDRDTEYDRYSYSFCGHSGSFYDIPWVGIVPTEPTELTISSESNGFLIIDKDGTRYRFTQPEYSMRYMGSDDPNAPPVNNTGSYYGTSTITAWHLTEIRSMDGKDVISLSYHQLPTFGHRHYSYYRSISFPYRYLGNDTWQTNLSGGSDPTPVFTTREWSYYTESVWTPQVVDSIAFNGGHVKFTYTETDGPVNQSRSYTGFLSSIRVKDSADNALYSWHFSKQVTGDYRYLLSSVSKNGRGGSLIEQWTMGYDSPNTSMDQNSVDLFGYYNGANNPSKSFLRPYNDEGTVNFSVANRNHNEANVGKLSLASITTASGSRTRYVYSSNSAPSGGYSNLFSGDIKIGQRISTISTYDLSGGTERLIRKRTFVYENPGMTIPTYAFQMGAFISTSEYNLFDDDARPGYWYGPLSPVRVCSIVYNDQSNLPGAPLESSRIFYNKVTEDISEDSVPLVRTIWEYDCSDAVSTGEGGAIWTNSDAHDSHYTNSNNYGGHFHQRVPVYIPRNGGQSNPHELLGYHFRDQNRPQLGNPVRVTSYKSSGSQFTPVSQTVYSYSFTYERLQIGMALTLKMSTSIDNHENPNIHCLEDVDQQQVERKIVYLRLREREDKEYLDNNTVKSVKTTYHYDYSPTGRTSFYSGNSYYSDSIHVPAMGSIQSPREEVAVYYNDTTKTYVRRVIYPDELVGVQGCGWATTLLSMGYRLPVGEELLAGPNQSYKAGRYVTWGYVPVGSWSAGIMVSPLFKPRQIDIYRDDVNVGPGITYALYDQAASPLEIHVQGQPVKTYAWGYNHRYPVAEVSGKSFMQVRDTLDVTQRFRMAQLADASDYVDSDFSLVRTAMRDIQPGALTTIRTYNPPYGTATEEDPSGRVVKYTYDYAGRLSAIKDENDNMLQSFYYDLACGDEGIPNEIDSYTYTSPGSLVSTAIQEVGYFDGLGRTIQTVSVGAATVGKDLVTPVVPDFLDREDGKVYLPYAASSGSSSGSYRTDALAAQQAYYGSGVKAYTENTYELSARGRVLSTSLPGFTDVTTYSSSFMAMPPYVMAVLRLSYLQYGLVAANGYETKPLTIDSTYRPDGSLSLTFTDEFGTPYLEKVKIDDTPTWADTYYIKDNIGRVICVVPPAEAAKLGPNNPTIPSENCYVYSYDGRDRVTYRKLPASAAEFITYNDADLPLTRTRLAADSLANEVFSTEYDAFNRPVREKYRYGDNPAITLANYYYDTYPADTLGFSSESGFAVAGDVDYRTKGLKTAETVTLIPDDVAPSNLNASNTATKVSRTFYYDKKVNVIQTAEVNHTGGISRTTSGYGFAGNLLSERQRVRVGTSSSTHTLDRTYGYDDRLRLTSINARLDSGTQATQSITYDDLGRTASVSRGIANETTQYNYTLQGWLSSVNSTSWSEHLRYQSPIKSATDSLPGKTGLVTEWEMTNITPGPRPLRIKNTYGYSYDKAGRLLNSLHYSNLSQTGTNSLTEQSITYDRSGNILTLKRYGSGSSPTLTDSLSFAYNGHRRNGWSYDAHANVTVDTCSGVSLAYNILDMPRTLSDSSATVGRSYLADGSLATVEKRTTSRIYLGNMVFKQLSGGGKILESASWEGGRIVREKLLTDKVLYYVTDHLGSIRVIKDNNGTVQQRFGYYPYGAANSGNPVDDTAEKRYGFGAKESVIADYLDFGARIYSPRTATWLTGDPLAEDYYPIGTHVYCAGNPVNLIDTNGLWIWGPHGNLLWQDGDNLFTLADYLGISALDALGILVRNTVHADICFSEGFVIQGDCIWTEPYNQSDKTINTTIDAVIHYYAGKDKSVNIGNNSTIEAISLINQKHPNIMYEKQGKGSINMTNKTFHIGRTNYSFIVEHKRNSLAIIYYLFIDDGFWDPNFVLEKASKNNNKADALGPNLELGGRPYRYNTKIRTYYRPPIFPYYHK